MREYEVTGAVFGLVCGLLMDATSTSTMGFHAVLLLIVGFACGLLINNLLNDTLRSAFLLGGAGTALYCVIHWVMTCAVRGLPNAGGFLLSKYLPLFCYTLVFLIPFYYLVGWIERRMRAGE